MLDLRRMMLLSDLADLGSVTAVAERRSITSSAVSQQLRVLEEEAGAVLFRRDGRTLGLTRSGQVLAEHVRRVLVAVDEAMSAVAETRDRVSGQVAIATFNMGIPTLAVPLMQRLSTEEPNLRVQVQQDTSAAALRLLRQGEVDVAITCQYDFLGAESTGGLTTVPLLFEPLVLLAPHPFASENPQAGPVSARRWVLGYRSAEFGAGDRRHTCLRERRFHATGQAPADRGTEHLRAGGNRDRVGDRAPAVGPANLESLVVGGIELGGRAISAVVRAGRQRDPNIGLILRTLRAIADQAPPGQPLRIARCRIVTPGRRSSASAFP